MLHPAYNEKMGIIMPHCRFGTVRIFLVFSTVLAFALISPAHQQQGLPKQEKSETIKITIVTTGIRKGSTSFSLIQDSDKADLIYAHDNSALFFSVAHGSQAPAASDISLTKKLGLLRLLLRRFFEVEGGAENYEFAFANYREIGPRVAEAALSSDGWDARNGRPITGDTNEFVKSLLNQRNLYPELVQVVAEFGYAISVMEVEHVIVEPARDCQVSTVAKRSSAHVDKLPCSMSIRFAIQRKKN